MKKNKLLIVFIIMNFIFNASAVNPELIRNKVNENTGLKILSWNIYMLPYLSLFNNNNSRAKSIVDILKNSDYQVIAFQEAFSYHCRKTLSKNLADAYPYQYGPANKNITPFRTNSGLWIVSKIPLKMLGEIQFSKSGGFDMIARKGAVLFEGNYKNTKFQLLTTHLQADFTDEVRQQQCTEIKEKLLNQWSNPEIPQFICGDFNIDISDGHNYTKLLQTLDAENGELTGNIHVTYDEIDNNLARKAKGSRKLIDYVLVRNAEFIEKIERKVQTFFSHVGGQESNLSDHYAMEFEVSFVGTEVSNVTIVATR